MPRHVDWHPANLLRGNVTDYVTDKWTAARRLTNFEKRHKVTFYALENALLADVRAAYSESLAQPDDVEALTRLRDAVGEMFHLEE